MAYKWACVYESGESFGVEHPESCPAEYQNSVLVDIVDISPDQSIDVIADPDYGPEWMGPDYGPPAPQTNWAMVALGALALLFLLKGR